MPTIQNPKSKIQNFSETMTGFVLAGGQSSRMGRDKALLAVGSRTLFELVMERLEPHVEQVLVVGNTQNLQPLKAVVDDRVLVDLQPDQGPLMGIYTGLMHTQTPLNVFVPCDMPWVEGRLIQQLAGVWQSPVEVMASLHPHEGLQPFPLVCHTKACRSIGALLDRGERSLKALLTWPGTQLVRIEEPGLWRSFLNVNTLTDYAKLCDEASVPS